MKTPTTTVTVSLALLACVPAFCRDIDNRGNASIIVEGDGNKVEYIHNVVKRISLDSADKEKIQSLSRELDKLSVLQLSKLDAMSRESEAQLLEMKRTLSEQGRAADDGRAYLISFLEAIESSMEARQRQADNALIREVLRELETNQSPGLLYRSEPWLGIGVFLAGSWMAYAFYERKTAYEGYGGFDQARHDRNYTNAVDAQTSYFRIGIPLQVLGAFLWFRPISKLVQ